MNRVEPELRPIAAALHAPAEPPSGPAWNLPWMADLRATDREVTPAAVLVALRVCAGVAQLLFTRRNEGLRQHAGQISFPGGRLEAHEGPLAAALREAQEEVALDPALVTPLGFLDPFLTTSGYHVYPLVARIAPDAALRAKPGEVAEIFEIPLAWVLDPANRRRVSIRWHGRERDGIEFQYGAYRIWGATAAMLLNLGQRLAQA